MAIATVSLLDYLLYFSNKFTILCTHYQSEGSESRRHWAITSVGRRLSPICFRRFCNVSMTLSSGSNFCYHPCISCQQSIISNPSSMQQTTSNMSYLYTILAQETGYVLLISPGLWLPLSRVVEKARWLQLEKFKSGCRSKSSRTLQTLPMLTLWCLTLFHKLLYQLPARCNGISLLSPHQVLEHLLYLLYHQSTWFFFMKSLFLITSFKRSSTSQANPTTESFLGFTYMFSLERLIINETRNLWNSRISHSKASTIELTSLLFCNILLRKT